MQDAVIHLVDDDPSVRNGLSRLLESAGWQVRTYESAFSFVGMQSPVEDGCLILDVQMPGMSGPELQEWLLARDAALPVIFLTAHGDLPTGIRAMKNGACDFLQKPVDERALFDAIHRALADQGRHHGRREQSGALAVRAAALTPREREVMVHVVAGRLNKQIADRMRISITTVKKHRAKVMEKMQVNSVADLVRACETLGIA